MLPCLGPISPILTTSQQYLIDAGNPGPSLDSGQPRRHVRTFASSIQVRHDQDQLNLVTYSE